jgi:predicted ArsR family transcriptional regulator
MQIHKANGYTRQEILTAIKVHGSMTADALGKELGISPVAVRQHLAALDSEGMVATSIERRAIGRPVHRYAITTRGDETFVRQYDALANSLLDELRHAQGEEAVEELFARRRARLASNHQLRMEGKSVEERVHELARIQAEDGYMASAEATEGGYLIVEHNCAVCQVARRHRAVCNQELALFRQLLGPRAKVERITHIAAGDHACTYRIIPEASVAE